MLPNEYTALPGRGRRASPPRDRCIECGVPVPRKGRHCKDCRDHTRWARYAAAQVANDPIWHSRRHERRVAQLQALVAAQFWPAAIPDEREGKHRDATE